MLGAVQHCTKSIDFVRRAFQEADECRSVVTTQDNKQFISCEVSNLNLKHLKCSTYRIAEAVAARSCWFFGRSWVPDFLQILKNGSCFTNQSLKKPGFFWPSSPNALITTLRRNRASSVSWRSSWYCATRIQKSSSSRPIGRFGWGIGVISVLSKGN